MSNGEETGISAKAIEMRLTNVKDAMQRTRFVFIVMTVVSSAIIFALWNDRLARDKDMAFGNDAYNNNIIWSRMPQPMHIYGRQQLVAEWYKNRIIQVGVLGVRLSVSDLAVTGSLTLLVITIWYYYSLRRENRATVTLLRDVLKEDVEVRYMVYQVIKHSSVFIKTEHSNDPLEGLNPAKHSTTDGAAAKEEGAAADEAEEGATTNETAVEQKETITDKTLHFLTFLPCVTIIAILVRDVGALFMQSPTSDTGLPLGRILLNQALDGQFSWGSAYPLIYVFMFDSVAVLLAIYTFILCKKGRAFTKATRDTLLEFEGTLGRDKSTL